MFILIFFIVTNVIDVGNCCDSLDGGDGDYITWDCSYD